MARAMEKLFEDTQDLYIWGGGGNIVHTLGEEIASRNAIIINTWLPF